METVGATERILRRDARAGLRVRMLPGGRVKLVMPDHIEARDLYVTAGGAGVQIRRINRRRDSLEDIFLRAMDNEAGQGGTCQSISTSTALTPADLTPLWSRVWCLRATRSLRRGRPRSPSGCSRSSLLPCLVFLVEHLSRQ